MECVFHDKLALFCKDMLISVASEFNGNNLMTYALKLKVDRGIPGEPILYLSGKYHT